MNHRAESKQSSDHTLSAALRRGTIALLLCLTFTGAALARSPEHDSATRPIYAERFHFSDGGDAPSYVLPLSDNAPAETVIFFVSGSGCASIKHRLAPFFAPIRGELNATVFALQKRGIDEENRSGTFCSTHFRHKDHFTQTLADQREFIENHIANLATTPRAVVLIGVSEGAVVAARLALTEPRLTHLGLIGGGGNTVRKNIQTLARTRWMLRNHERAFEAIADDPYNTVAQQWSHSHNYWAELLDIHIGDALAELTIPIVAAMGEQDDAVPVDAARELEQRFQQLGKTNLLLLIFPDANHRLEDTKRQISYAGDFLTTLMHRIRESSPALQAVTPSPTNTPETDNAVGNTADARAPSPASPDGFDTANARADSGPHRTLSPAAPHPQPPSKQQQNF